MVDNNIDTNTLDLKCIDREETIKTFNNYSEKEDKIIYLKKYYFCIDSPVNWNDKLLARGGKNSENIFKKH